MRAYHQVSQRHLKKLLGQRQRLIGLSLSSGAPSLWRLPMNRVQWESESVSEIRYYR